MKIFKSWWQKKPRKQDDIATAARRGSSSLLHTAARSGNTSILHTAAMGFPVTPVDDDQQQPDLPHSFCRSHDIKSLQDMFCPIYSSDLLHYKKPIEDINTHTLTKEYDMNTILYIGTLGGETNNMMAAEMDNENIISILGVPLVDNGWLKVAQHEQSCAHLLTTQKHASDVGDEGSYLKEIHIKGPSPGSTSSNDKVHLNEEIMKGQISRVNTNDELNVTEILTPCNDNAEKELKCAKSTISSLIHATLQEELKKKQDIVHQPGYTSANYGNPTNYNNIAEGINKNNHFLTVLTSEELVKVNEKIVNGHGMKNNMDEDLFINNELNLVKSTTMKEFLKGLYMLEEEVTEQVAIDYEPNKCSTAQGMMGASRSTVREISMMGSSRNVQGIMGSSSAEGFSRNAQSIMGSASSDQEMMGSSISRSSAHGTSENTQGVMCSSTSVMCSCASGMGPNSPSAQGIMGSSIVSTGTAKGIMGFSTTSTSTTKGIMGASKNTQGIMGSSTYTSAQGRMGSSSSAQEIMCSSTDRIEGIMSFEQTRSTKPKDNTMKDEEEHGHDENLTTHNIDCLKIASTCNNHMDLKRFIAAVTPNNLTKHLLKRLKLGHIQMQIGLRHGNYGRKFLKELCMPSTRSSNIIHRKLGPLLVHDVHISSNKDLRDNEQECIEKKASDLQNTIERCSFSPCSNENWINTDDEYVILELE